MDSSPFQPTSLPMEAMIPEDLSIVDPYTFESIKKGEIVRERMKRLEDDHEYSDQYIAFQGVSQPDFDMLYKVPSLTYKICLKSYFTSSQILVAKVRLGVEQAIIEHRMQSFIGRDCYATGLTVQLHALGLSVLELQGWYKEADTSWGMRTISPELHRTLAFEIGVSESEHRMSLDARRWLENPTSTMNIVITISINRVRPKMVIRRYEICPRETRHSPRMACIQTIELTGSHGRVHISAYGSTSAPQLEIPFSKVFGRAPSRSIDKDFAFSSERFDNLAREVWEILDLTID